MYREPAIMGADNDLSEYEQLRLANIRRNNEFLSSLGLADNKPQRASSESSKAVVTKSKKRQKEVVVEGTRKSSRLNNVNIDDNSNVTFTAVKVNDYSDEKENSDFKIDYGDIPMESNELDDFEFEIFTILKKWRLLKCRLLDIEPYKIFQNRTLVEVIRRRRNNCDWAKVSDDDVNKRKVDLLETWGIGNSKVQDDGFGIELIEFIDSEDEINKLFVNSRMLKNSQ